MTVDTATSNPSTKPAVSLSNGSGQELVGFLWIKLGPYQEDEVRCCFVPEPAGKAAWDFDRFVDPAHRFGLAFVRLWDEANRFLRERGVEWVMSRIEASASASLASHRRMGTRVVGRALFLTMWRFQLTLTDLRPYVHLSTRAGVIPELQVAPLASDASD